MAVPASQPTETLRERHWTARGLNPITALCERTVAADPGIRSLAHFSGGVLDFVVRRAGAEPPAARPGTVPGDDDGEAEAEALRGHRLLLCAQDLGALLRPLGTGDLMRTVVAGDDGALWGGRVKPGEYLAAATDTPDGVDSLDNGMNDLVTALRTRVHSLPGEFPGGDPAAVPGTTVADDDIEDLRVDFGRALAVDAGYEEWLRSLWRLYVNPTDLQYAGYYRDWTLVCVGDVFDAPDLAPRFLDVSVRNRRAGYRDLARGLRGHLVRLADALHPTTAHGTGPAAGRPSVTRLVLDVQEGAVYVRWTTPRTFVLGVTLDQSQVANAEAGLHRLAEALAGPAGRPPYPTP
ncbi:hypothetical protein ACN20G_30315 (plasmid) [Streptomyces sp. BI20]|uniref:hypothetical protein n=1 Tax=Streptomyces sp. BI20 TaxID=3403460 RepID=UPI003C762DA7